MNNSYLLDEYPLLVMPSLAKKIGLNKAIVLQQCHYWLQRTSNVREGRKWFYKTYEEWMGELPFWSDKTIRRTITELEKDKLLITDNFNQKRSDKTKWYTIDYEIFNQIMNEKLVTSPCGQSDQSSRSDCPERLVKMTASIPDITTDIINDDDEDDPSVQEKSKSINRNDAIQMIEKRFLQRRGTGLFCSPNDIQSIADVVDTGIEVNKVITYIDEVFNNYTPKHPRDRINSFSYVAQYIFTRNHQDIERERVLGGNQSEKHCTSTERFGGTKSKICRKDEEIRGTQKQRLIGQDGEIQDTECDF